MAETPWSQCRGPRFDSCSGSWIPHAAAKTRCWQINLLVNKNLKRAEEQSSSTGGKGGAAQGSENKTESAELGEERVNTEPRLSLQGLVVCGTFRHLTTLSFLSSCGLLQWPQEFLSYLIILWCMHRPFGPSSAFAWLFAMFNGSNLHITLF